MSALCQLCGRPMFEGVAGYVGPQCRCLWGRLPKKQDAIEAGNAELRRYSEALQSRVVELEAKLTVPRKEEK